MSHPESVRNEAVVGAVDYIQFASATIGYRHQSQCVIEWNRLIDSACDAKSSSYPISRSKRSILDAKVDIETPFDAVVPYAVESQGRKKGSERLHIDLTYLPVGTAERNSIVLNIPEVQFDDVE